MPEIAYFPSGARTLQIRSARHAENYLRLGLYLNITAGWILSPWHGYELCILNVQCQLLETEGT